jgi:CheY-like chemotaxis protein
MKRLSGSAISRHQVFVLADGTYAVQWDDKRVQELYSGKYRAYLHTRDFGHHITDVELGFLKGAGRVEHYNRKYVWLFALPEAGRYANRRILDRGNKIRVYYLSTGLARSQLTNVRAALDSADLSEVVKPGVRANTIVLLDPNGRPYRSFEDIEALHVRVSAAVGPTLGEFAIAFIEVDPKDPSLLGERAAEALPSLDEIIASQSDTTATAGRQIVLAINMQEEREAFTDLLIDMQVAVHHAERGQDAQALLEDHRPDMLITETQLPDMHSLQLISNIKEDPALRDLPILVISDEANLSMTVARVEYLIRPVSIARLRFLVWKSLRERVSNPR